MNIFGNLQISPTSFWLGFLSGILFAWIFTRAVILFPRLFHRINQRLIKFRENFSISAEVHLRNDVYSFSQKQHLAASLFSLDEIAIQPKVLIPLIQTPYTIEHAFTDSASLSIPYIPDWPELAAAYNASTMSLIEALQGGSNIILAGHTGYGKTFALAWLSARLAQNDKGLGKLTGFLPLYIHATDIPNLFDQYEVFKEKAFEENLLQSEKSAIQQSNPLKSADEVIEIIIQTIASYVSPATISKLPNIVRMAITNQNALLLIDRVDELPPMQAKLVIDYLRLLIQQYPKFQIIIAMSYDNLEGLPTLGFSLIGLSAWNENDHANLAQLWSEQWSKWITPLLKQSGKQVYKHFLKSWLSTSTDLLTPLEYTLKIWSAFSGDILGTDGSSAVEAYIRRMIAECKECRPGLEQIALQLLIEKAVAIKPKTGEKFYREVMLEVTTAENQASQNSSSATDKIRKIQIPDSTQLDTLANNGFLIKYPGDRLGFGHPLFYGYLAGQALADSQLISQAHLQPSWVSKNLSLYYLSRHGDVSSLIQSYLQEDDVIHTNHLLISRWLQVAPKNRPWRSIILRTLTSVLQKESETASLSAKIISALAFSGDAGVSLYFRQLMKSEHAILKPLAALGCGILGDKNTIDDLNQMMQEQSPASIRAASLALAQIGDKRALEILASYLLNGHELMRRCAAEALSNNEKEGHPALREGSAMEDLQVRHSVIFGLIRIEQPWARKIVENLQLEDNEWVVRTAAIQAFDELNNKICYAPAPLSDLTETPWLVDFASRMGTTIAPGKPAEELVIKVLSNGTPEEKLFAIDYFRNKCYPRSMDLLYSTYQSTSSDMRDALYHVLWLMAISGIRLPLLVEKS